MQKKFPHPPGAADLAAIRKHLRSPGTSAYTEWRWVFYGDSITHGAKHTCGWRSFPEIFAERVRYELHLGEDIVINSGISGHTTVQLLDELEFRVRIAELRPHVVLLMIGCNDSLKVPDIAVFQKNLTMLVRKFRELGAIPVLQTCTPIRKTPENPDYMTRFERLPAYNDAIRRTAAESDAVLVDHDARWREIASSPEKLARLLGEAIHPGALGHLEIAKEIFRVFGIFDSECPCCHPFGTPFSIPPETN